MHVLGSAYLAFFVTLLAIEEIRKQHTWSIGKESFSLSIEMYKDVFSYSPFFAGSY